MTDTERDTHFLGYANLLWTEICKLPGVYIETDRPEQFEAIPCLIAQRAYDFAQHVTESLDPLHPGVDSAYVALLAKKVENIPDIPDFTEWPKAE